MRESVYQTNGCGMAVAATGREALIQEAYIRLQMKKGAFVYGREIGSLFYRLREAPEKERVSLAFSYAQAALTPVRDVRVIRAELEPDGGTAQNALITLELYGQQEKVRVRL